MNDAGLALQIHYKIYSAYSTDKQNERAL